ncbi:PDZ domain-containing protein [Parashewanella curva]|uniref:PDZ domain-containing protein n=1 Tax=Parashewanella curva TaxID=2338552 RepID=A0A3L8PT11_9GAMM|nr:S41 family peptidase [Parashewanella curva]RLV58476.1 PDZ domain-containing protein [Parashewanella curva]
MKLCHFSLISILTLSVSACGGGGSSEPQSESNNETSPLTWQLGQFLAASTFKDYCAKPRTGNFPDKQGTEQHEKMWLRSWNDNTYLWYKEVTDKNPAPFSVKDYFAQLKTTAQTPSGNPKDNFHFSRSTEEWKRLSQGGVSLGYGAEITLIRRSPPRKAVVAFTEPNTPASNKGLARGDEIVAINGADFATSNDLNLLNSALFPSKDDTEYNFTLRRVNGSEYTVTMTPTQITSAPVQNVKTIETDSGKVGYFTFNGHIQPAESQLKSAIDQLANENVSDLVVDLRYNGGGFLILASQLAYMVAGSENTQNKTFELNEFNDKHPTVNPVTGEPIRPLGFANTGVGLTLDRGTPLPSLNLNRVFVLTTDSTCSASEAFINGLRGIDIEVVQIGGKTCGKPYGFYAQDNCGETYFTIQFKGSNHKGFGDYSDGFEPSQSPVQNGTQIAGCLVDDDYSHALGDKNEAMLKAALNYRTDKLCPSLPSSFGYANQGIQLDESDEKLAVKNPNKDFLKLVLQNKIITTSMAN